MAFESNQGQASDRFDFISRGPGYMLGLSPTEAVLSLSRPSSSADADGEIQDRDDGLLKMEIVGGSRQSQASAENVLPGVVNYYPGEDRDQWRTGIRTYQRVRYSQVYPGIDLVYYGSQRQLEYDFVVAPQADPSRIALAFEGADDLEINDAGELVVHTGPGAVRLRKPLVYQNDGEDRKEIAADYVLNDGGRVGFQVAMYDPQRELVIDPVLTYSTYFGGSPLIGDCSRFDWVNDVAVDPAGSFYIVGQTDSATLPGSVEENTFCNQRPGFVAKFRPDGKSMVYTTFYGTRTECYGVVADSSGNACIVGTTNGTVPTTAVAYQARASAHR